MDDEYSFERYDKHTLNIMYFSLFSVPKDLSDVNTMLQSALLKVFKYFEITEAKRLESKRKGNLETGHAIIHKDIDFKVTARYDFIGLCEYLKVSFERNGIKKEFEYSDALVNLFGVINMEARVEKEVFDAFDDLLSPTM